MSKKYTYMIFIPQFNDIAAMIIKMTTTNNC